MSSQLGTVSGGITADILGAINSATGFLSGTVLWEDYEFVNDADPRIEVWGTDPADNAQVVYPLPVEIIEGDIFTKEQEAALYTSCTSLICCSRCGINTSGSCYCKVSGTGCGTGACETRTYGWIGNLADVTWSYV